MHTDLTTPTAGITLVVIGIKGNRMLCTCVEDGKRVWVPVLKGIGVGEVMRNVQFKKS